MVQSISATKTTEKLEPATIRGIATETRKLFYKEILRVYKEATYIATCVDLALILGGVNLLLTLLQANSSGVLRIFVLVFTGNPLILYEGGRGRCRNRPCQPQ